MGSADSLAALWPVFGLVIRTPRLVLRLPRESELPALARAAREIVQRCWRSLAHWKPESWHLVMAVYTDDEPIGVQDIWAADFARTRSVGTGSWVTLSQQGKGFGTEARAAILELAFSSLGAEEARTEYYDGNMASERVSRKLGYVTKGARLAYLEGSGQVTEYHLRLTRDEWEQARSGHRVTVAGIERCSSMFGMNGDAVSD